MYEEKNKKVLIIMPKPPYPMADGGCIAMANSMLLWEKAGFDVHVFCLSTPKHPFCPDAFPEEWTEGKNLFHHFVDTRWRLSHFLPILFSQQSYQASRFFSQKASKKFQHLIQRHCYPVILFDSLYSAIYLPEIKKVFTGQMFLRSHNIEHQIWHTLRMKEPNPLKRMILLYETSRLKRWEKSILQQVNGIFTITENDELAIRQAAPTTTVVSLPVSMIISVSARKRSVHTPLRMFHLGAMNWEPNQDAIRWFIRNWFPMLQTKFKDITFHFAGKAMPKEFESIRQSQIFCHGEVPDASAFMQQHDVLVVPLRFGSGLRIKILEAMAMGIPVISTRKGAEGIPVIHKENILLADDPVSFCEAINQLIHTPGLYEHLSQQGLALIQKHYTLEACSSVIRKITNSV